MEQRVEAIDIVGFLFGGDISEDDLAHNYGISIEVVRQARLLLERKECKT